MPGPRSTQAYKEACRYFPGGVNSPVRAFKGVGSQPFVVESGAGARLRDVDGREYIDYVLSWGPLVLGHAHPEVCEAVTEALGRGWSYGAPCLWENRLAEAIVEIFPSIEMLRFVSSGTEAVMSALRLARAATGRDLIVKCDGGYHGHTDSLLVQAGSGLATLGTSSSAGVPEAFAATTLVIPMNDAAALEKVFEEYPDRIAAFILEPVAGNIGVVPPEPRYLQTCKDICHRYRSLIIFDEVMCGFRAALGGAQEKYGVSPDLTILGKVIGGGFPVGAYGGRQDLLEQVAPLGAVYQAGTLSGNPVAMVAGLKTLEILKREGHTLAMRALDRLQQGLEELLREKNLSWPVQRVGSMFSLFMTEGPVRNYQDTQGIDRERFGRFHAAMLEQGVYLAPSPFEAGFTSSAHSDEHIDRTLDAFRHSLAALR